MSILKIIGNVMLYLFSSAISLFIFFIIELSYMGGFGEFLISFTGANILFPIVYSIIVFVITAYPIYKIFKFIINNSSLGKNTHSN